MSCTTVCSALRQGAELVYHPYQSSTGHKPLSWRGGHDLPASQDSHWLRAGAQRKGQLWVAISSQHPQWMWVTRVDWEPQPRKREWGWDSDSTASEGKWLWWFQSWPSSRSRVSKECELPSAVPFGSQLAVLECSMVIFLRDENRTSKCYRLIWELELEMFSPQFTASVPLCNGC